MLMHDNRRQTSILYMPVMLNERMRPPMCDHDPNTGVSIQRESMLDRRDLSFHANATSINEEEVFMRRE